MMLGDGIFFEVGGLRNHTDYKCHNYARSISYRRNVWAALTGGLPQRTLVSPVNDSLKHLRAPAVFF